MSQDGSAPTDVQFSPSSGGVTSFELTVIDGGRSGTLRVDASMPDRAFVGQSAAADLVVEDRLVSRRHLAVEVRGSHLFVEDLGSTNGTFVGGVRVIQALLHGGEHISIGNTRVAVVRAPDVQTESIPTARSFERVVGSSLAMRRIYPLLERLAASEAPLLLEGETGTGKELVAETLHERSLRSGRPFVVFDCTTSLLEGSGASALLGDVRGTSPVKGAFELADGGTLLLDEVGELPIELQPLLLRAIERGEIQRVGDPSPIKVSVRVIATTRLDLDRAIADGSFRDDLFYRLATTRLELPPLRQRDGDIGVLSRHFWAELGGDPAAIPYEAFETLERSSFPGNVRELQGAVTRILTTGVPREPPPASSGSAPLKAFCRTDVPYARAKEELLETFEREYVARMVEHHGSIQRAASASGLALRYFQLLRAKHRRP